ncbi:leucine-rich repeat-containing protein 74B-like [Ostrea edulis]|uniref:leucine-rich repeat-containing protein 74B-like n=1 Tax=Ostrea edulis TaxID=37623 RepID=UPI0024AE9089|nr:leucine-rich repeat-containing protein 74B-like [Ostrea edulis]XP_056012931.1 leucine-rich repeat-containing protein 74B-like [Ostrea edulis]XP_056012932.1 leucine-rich repeat-containing protein 74B-like [Ostrea edulis]
MTVPREQSEIFLTNKDRYLTSLTEIQNYSCPQSPDQRNTPADVDGDFYFSDTPTPEAPETVAPSTSQNTYLKACKMLTITPSNFCLRCLNEVTLVIPYHGIGPTGAKAVAIALVNNSTVSCLDLSSNGLESTGLFYILEMLQSNKVISNINLAGNDLGSRGARLLSESLRKNKTLTKLNISGNNFSEKDANYLAKLIKRNKTLKDLILSHNTFREQGGVILGEALESNCVLKKLDLSWNHLRQLGAVAICWSVAENTCLTSLDLSWNGFGMEGCHEMGKSLLRNRTLTYLDLSANRVSFDAFRQLLRGVVHNKILKVLKVGINPITTDGAFAILQSIAVSDSSLEEIDLKDVSVDRDFVDLLEKIQKQRHLVCNYGNTLRHDEIKKGDVTRVLDTDDPVTVLFEYMKQKNLRLIDLLHNLDRDHSDTISRDEFQQGLSNIDLPLSGRSLDILMRKLDTNRDGSVDYEELSTRHKEYMRKITKLRLQADLGPSYYKGYDKLEQLREAVRLKISLSMTRQKTDTS